MYPTQTVRGMLGSQEARLKSCRGNYLPTFPEAYFGHKIGLP